MSVYVLCVNSIMFILSICSIPLTLCFVFVFILFSVLPYGEIKLCISQFLASASASALMLTLGALEIDVLLLFVGCNFFLVCRIS